ncbi:MAG TPA: hypothetical protein VMW54_10925 [Terriglobia bacterium]|nr:hypothetical protein [Terriglobia bacterium]
MDKALHTAASFPFRVLCWLIDMFLLAALFGFVILFILQFTHSPKLLHWGWIVGLKRVGDPVLAEISSWVRMDWPADMGFSFIPIVMAFFTWLVNIAVDGIFLKGSSIFSKIGRSFQPPAGGRIRPL